MDGSRFVAGLEVMIVGKPVEFGATEEIVVAEDLSMPLVSSALILIAVDVAVVGDDDKRRLKRNICEGN